MKRKAVRRRSSTPAEQKRAGRFASQLFVWRYCENHWWRMSEGWEFRGLVPPKTQPAAHNLALFSRQHWHVYSITYLKDNNGKLYREFCYHQTKQRIVGSHDGVHFLMKEAMEAAESGLNSKHIYGRAMVFAPWSKAYPSLLPILRRKKAQLRLTDADLEALEADEKSPSKSQTKLLDMSKYVDLDDKIAALL